MNCDKCKNFQPKEKKQSLNATRIEFQEIRPHKPGDIFQIVEIETEITYDTQGKGRIYTATYKLEKIGGGI
jgi:hypothetical protein